VNETHPLLRVALMKAMEDSHGMPSDEPDGDEGPAVKTKPRMDEEEDPRSQQEDDIFLDPELFDEVGKPKKGEEVLVRVKIKSVGSKIAAEIIEVEPDDEDEEDEGEEDGEGADEENEHDEDHADAGEEDHGKGDYMDKFEK